MLAGLHDFFRRHERLGVPTAALVRGRCLGGGFELALSSGWIFAGDDATLGCPEVKLGVFAPLASLLLPWRTGGSAATDLLVTGRVVDAATAKTLGIVNDVSPDPEAALWRWYDEHLAPSSAVALRHAWVAVRRPVRRMFDRDLAEIEALYMDSLMSHRDPVEGLRAFLEHRSPAWRHA
jgi:cyclohexa-1,5-dienecarbonyl-CoA hydratase